MGKSCKTKPFAKLKRCKSKVVHVPTPREIVDRLDQSVIGQNIAKKTLAVAIRNHFRRLSATQSNEGVKSNILIIGPSGSGKTYMVEKALQQLEGIPSVVADATQLTAEGYVGQSVGGLLQAMIRQAGGNIARAEYGVLVIDEIDKLASCSGGGGVDVGGKKVQEELLKLVEGKRWSEDSSRPGRSGFSMETKKMLVIAMGAFEGIQEASESRRGTTGRIGFNMNRRSIATSMEGQNCVLPEDLVRYGMIRELVGRFPVICSTDELSSQEYAEVLCNENGGIIQEYQAILAREGVDLTFSDSAIEQIASMTKSAQTGVRGARGLLERLLRDVMYAPVAYGPNFRIDRDTVMAQLTGDLEMDPN